MVTFLIGLFIGTMVGITSMCLLVLDKGEDRLDEGSTP
jgi:hypothetical protein